MGYWDRKDASFNELVGKTLLAVHVNDDNDEVRFVDSDDVSYWMGHHQDCCEHVYLEDVNGDWSDMIGSPILLAEVATQDTTPEDFQHDYEPESQTWTFYKLATAKGHVTLRWFGESNGYYSEAVDFQIDPSPTSEASS